MRRGGASVWGRVDERRHGTSRCTASCLISLRAKFRVLRLGRHTSAGRAYDKASQLKAGPAHVVRQAGRDDRA